MTSGYDMTTETPKHKYTKKATSKTVKETPKDVVSKIVDNEFVITITIDNLSYQGTGVTALDALRAVSAPTIDLISSGSVYIEHNGKSKDMFFSTLQMRRLLNPYNMEVLINDLQEGL